MSLSSKFSTSEKPSQKQHFPQLEKRSGMANGGIEIKGREEVLIAGDMLGEIPLFEYLSIYLSS